ncbi:MAG TPA: alanine racemase [Desulfomicrobiaceae bacterium]|nr:alanine racemase [Desulfomicrobiaceae bacterium]
MHCLPIWAEIDLDAIAHNLKEIRRNIGPAPEIMAVVKANAYGHGAVRISQLALRSGADRLAVARVGEGIELREAGITAPLLVLGYAPEDCAPDIVRHRLTPTIYSLQAAQVLSEEAVRTGKSVPVHIKIDTGMGRLGIPAGQHLGGSIEKAVDEISAMSTLPGIELEGIYTHFACADSTDKSNVLAQLDLFNALLDTLDRRSIHFSIRHCANSASIIDIPQARFDLVRAGIMLYGLYPSAEVDKSRVLLKPAMQLKARIAHIKEVPAGCPISYGATHVTTAPTRIATIPVGYADGYSRLLSSRAAMLVREKRVPVVGRVCMDQTMIDVREFPDLKIGDEVTVLGAGSTVKFDSDDIARLTGTINYEVVSTITARVPRIYLKDSHLPVDKQ